MIFKSLSRNFSLVALALALSTGPSIGFAQTSGSDQISDLLKQAKSHAVMAEDDAAKLKSYAWSKVSWQSHAAQLDRIKGHINELGQLNKQLSDSRAEGSPWQQEAIDQIDPQIREMADLLTATIKHLNNNQSHVHMQPFQDYPKANAELTSRFAKLIDDFVDYDAAKSKAEFLERKLELPEVARRQ
jgi:hypothetical protein